jgi:acetyl esterase/lipase
MSRSASPRWIDGPASGVGVEVWTGRTDLPLVVLVHGGFWRPAWDRTHLHPLAEAFAAQGLSVALPEYRRVPGEPDTGRADLAAGLALAPTVAPHDGTVVLVGHSAGGHLALLAAATAPPPGLRRTVGLAAVADLALADLLDLGSGAVPAYLGGPATTRPDLDPARLPTPDTPVHLVVAGRDTDVPATVAASYAGGRRGVVVVTVEDADHMDLVDPASPSWPVVRDAVLSEAARGPSV